jgi:predicted RNA-binding protein with PIN domain
LQEFCRREQKQVEVFFDGAPPTHAGTRRLGAVTAYFVRRGTTADNEIRKRLKTLGKGAHNWTVVSSDRQVQAEARAASAEILSSGTFAALLNEGRKSSAKTGEDKQLSPTEVDEWLKLFEERNPSKKYGGNFR